MKKISVCVPTYKRPEMLRQLINSYLKQDYKNKELILCDDSPDDSTKNLVDDLGKASIKYYRNKTSLGFSRNLFKALGKATGDYLFIIGDDDVLLNETVLSDYVKIFNSESSVGFIYANQIQFSGNMNVDYIMNFTTRNKLLKMGKDAMENVLIRSIFIGGIGVRNSKDLLALYPSKKILHPQVEFIGNIINRSDAYLLAKNHVGFRAHGGQIIFSALKDKKVRQAGDHMTIELLNIFKKINKKYLLNMRPEFLERQLIELQIIMLFKEKIILGSKNMEKSYRNFCAVSSEARNSMKFKLAFFTAKILPSTVASFSRLVIMKSISYLNKSKFNQYRDKLFFMTSNT